MDDPILIVDRITTCLETLPLFAYDIYAPHVQSVLCIDKADVLTPCTSELFGEPAGGEIGALDRFKVETIALAVAKYPQYGFSATVIKKGFYSKFIESASKLVYTVYRKYLEDHLAAEIPEIQLLALFKDHEFCYAWIQKLLDPSFLNKVIHRFADQPQYLEALSYIYERTRETMLHMSDRFFHDESAGKIIVLSDIARGSLPAVGPFLRVVEECKHLHNPGALQRFISKACPVEWSDPCLLRGPSFPTLGKIWAYRWSADEIAKEPVKALIDETTYLTLPFVPGAIGEWYTACDVVHGDRLWQWILKQQNTNGDLFHVRHPENHELVDPLASCFAPDTLVETEQGPVPIATIEGGARVLTRPPKDYGMVSNERVMRDSTIHRHQNVEQVLLLYGFNGEKPFVTSGHVFFTTTGPKALDPKIAQAENPGIHVTKLKIGDRMYRLNEDRTACQAVEIMSISHERATCLTVHGLHFSRGANGGRYFANGYWVGENYPDVTVHSLLQRFATLTAQEQNAFVKSVGKLPNTFRKVFGHVTFDAFQKAFAHPLDALHHFRAGKDSLLTSVEHAASHDVSIKRLVATFRLVSAVHLADRKPLLDSTYSRYERMIAHINEGMQLPTLTLANGAVLCDGVPVERASMSHLSVRWSREIPNSKAKYEHGALRIIAHGRAVTGVIGYGNTDTNVSELQHMHYVYALADANDYHLVARTKWSTSVDAAEDESLGDGPMREPFWTVRIGLARQGSGVTICVTLPDLDDEYEARYSNGNRLLSPYVLAPMSFTPESGILKIPVKLRPGMEQTLRDCISSWSGVDPPGPAFESFTLTLDLQTNEVHGYYREIADDEDGNFSEGTIHALFSRHSDSIEETNVLSLKCVQSGESSNTTDANVNMHDTPGLYHASASSASRELLPFLFNAAALSISDLQSMPVPPADKLFHLAQEYLQQAAIYWRGKAEVDIFGDQRKAAKHIVPLSLTDKLDADSRIFLAEYDRMLSLNNLANSQDYGNLFTEEDCLVIKYYFRGSSPGCLSQNAAFNKLWKIAVSEAFITQAPTIKAYVEDSHDWAQEFFDYVTTDAQLNAQAFGGHHSSTINLTIRYCAILSILDTEDRQFDIQLWSLVRNKLLLHLASGTIETNAYDWAGFATEFTRVLIDRVESGSKPALMHQLSIDLKVLREVLFTSSAADIAGAIFGTASPLGRSFLEAVQSTDGIVARNGLANFSTLMSKFFTAIDKNWRTLARVKPHLISFCAVAVQGFTCYASLSTMLNWNELTNESNANAVLAAVDITINACHNVGPVIADLRNSEPTDPCFQEFCMRWNEAVGLEGPHLSFEDLQLPHSKHSSAAQSNEWSLRNVSQTAQALPLEMQMASAACDPQHLIGDLETIFGFSSVSSNTIAAAASVTSAMCLSLGIAREIRDGSPMNKESIDTINDLCIAAEIVSGASKVGFPTSGLICGINPHVGSIVAATGALLQFAEAAERPAQIILGPLEPYLDRIRTTLFRFLPSPPSPQLAYTYEPAELLCGFHGSVSIIIRNTQPQEVLIDSITIRFAAGSGDNDMFLAPSGDDGKGNPTNNRVHYVLENGHNVFHVIGSKLAGTSDHAMVLQLYSVDAMGSAIPSEGLKLSISGTVNPNAGQTTIHITENTNKRPCEYIASDVYCAHKVVKCDSWVEL